MVIVIILNNYNYLYFSCNFMFHVKKHFMKGYHSSNNKLQLSK